MALRSGCRRTSVAEGASAILREGGEARSPAGIGADALAPHLVDSAGCLAERCRAGEERGGVRLSARDASQDGLDGMGGGGLGFGRGFLHGWQRVRKAGSEAVGVAAPGVEALGGSIMAML